MCLSVCSTRARASCVVCGGGRAWQPLSPLPFWLIVLYLGHAVQQEPEEEKAEGGGCRDVVQHLGREGQSGGEQQRTFLLFFFFFFYFTDCPFTNEAIVEYTHSVYFHATAPTFPW